MRKLATVRTVKEIRPIPDADNIEVAVIDNWSCVTQKNEVKIGEDVVYFEIDSFLPVHPAFEFLRKNCYRKMDDSEGFRLKTIKLRKQLSQGLVLSVSYLREQGLLKKDSYAIGDDVSEEINVINYEPPTSFTLSGNIKGVFRSVVPKTDEERVQNLNYSSLLNKSYYSTEKLEGTSITIYLIDNEFGVCSRNYDLYETEDNLYWKVVRQMDLERKIRDKINFNVAFQGELIGEGVQGNIYKLKGNTIKFFNIFDITNGYYLPYEVLQNYSRYLEIDLVPEVNYYYYLPENFEELLDYAKGKSLLNSSTEREGVVIRERSGENRISFKVINNDYLLKQKD